MKINRHHVSPITCGCPRGCYLQFMPSTTITVANHSRTPAEDLRIMEETLVAIATGHHRSDRGDMGDRFPMHAADIRSLVTMECVGIEDRGSAGPLLWVRAAGQEWIDDIMREGRWADVAQRVVAAKVGPFAQV